MRTVSAVIALTVAVGIGWSSRVVAQPERVTPEQFEETMKAIASANEALRSKLMKNDATDAATEAQRLATLFGEAERFWAQNRKPDAVALAQQARKGATDAAGAAATGDLVKAQTAANGLAAACQQCHGLYREGNQDSGFRIKAGVLDP